MTPTGSGGGHDTVSRLLARARDGDREALDELFPLVYDILRERSRRELRRAGREGSLDTTELVHEAYLKLAPGTAVDWRDRTHFVRVAARAMRQVLVDRARRHAADRRRREGIRCEITGGAPGFGVAWDDLLSLDRALERLAEVSVRLHRVVELRFFGGLSEEEVASALGVSPRTVRRDWTKARLFLHREMYPEAEPG